MSDERLIATMAAMKLAGASTSKSIIAHYAPNFDTASLLAHHVKDHPRGWNHRQSEAWTKTDDAVYAVRAHRLFCDIFENNRDYEMKLTAKDLWDWYFTYTMIYPQDEMTANRMHYMVGLVREGKLRIKPACNNCGKGYVVHRDQYIYDDCAICRKIATVQAQLELAKSQEASKG